MKKERGFLTVEATISLTAFMFAFLTVLSVVNICHVQAKMAVALNLTAKEISQYSYIYSLTGLNEREAEIAAGAEETKNKISDSIGNVSTVFREVDKMKVTKGQVAQNPMDPETLGKAVEDISNNAAVIGGSVEALEALLREVASDPKEVIFGLARLAGTEAWQKVKSMIAAPLAKTLVQKHLNYSSDLKDKEGADAFLRSCGVVPKGSSYLDGLDFSRSKLFTNGSAEIELCVTYQVKVIQLLPIKSSFTFTQRALTKGWMGGHTPKAPAEDAPATSGDPQNSNYKPTESTWTSSTVTERASMIRNMGIQDALKQGELKIKGATSLHTFDKKKNQFTMFSSMNPLYSEDPSHPMTPDQIKTDEMVECLHNLCGKMKSQTKDLKQVTTVNKDGAKVETNCTNAGNHILLTIPEDAGLEAKMKEVVAQMEAKYPNMGVEIELNSSFGLGASGVEDVK